ncbi:MAG: serine/threonine protein kinase, partial [Thermoleophilia bacterium]|nr:serine/threonine protein kinase [Thermoleophilia bacterium]
MAETLRAGTVVEGYRIEGQLGKGGMGVVYEACDLFLGERRVALKLISSDIGDDPAFRERFKREAEVQAGLEHPHIITVYRAGESEHGLYIAMRLIRGPNLKELILRGELDPERTGRVLSQIADALDNAHEVGLIHRDIKPYNILIDGRRDHSFLADFGIAKARGRRGLTKTGQMPGTPDYISPEQILGRPATERSDVYSFGAVLFECLSGVVPYPKDTDIAVIYAHLSGEIPSVTDHRPELPAAVDAVIAKAMAKEPDDRYPSASELMRDFERALGERGWAGPAVALAPRAGDTERGQRTTDAALKAEAQAVEEPEEAVDAVPSGPDRTVVGEPAVTAGDAAATPAALTPTAPPAAVPPVEPTQLAPA